MLSGPPIRYTMAIGKRAIIRRALKEARRNAEHTIYAINRALNAPDIADKAEQAIDDALFHGGMAIHHTRIANRELTGGA